MKDSIEKHQFKITIATAIVVVLFIVTIAMQYATWKAEISAEHTEFDDRITHVGEKVVNMRAEIAHIQDHTNVQDIELAKINTKLANIEMLLLEIKDDIKS